VDEEAFGRWMATLTEFFLLFFEEFRLIAAVRGVAVHAIIIHVGLMLAHHRALYGFRVARRANSLWSGLEHLRFGSAVFLMTRQTVMIFVLILEVWMFGLKFRRGVAFKAHFLRLSLEQPRLGPMRIVATQAVHFLLRLEMDMPTFRRLPVAFQALLAGWNGRSGIVNLVTGLALDAILNLMDRTVKPLSFRKNVGVTTLAQHLRRGFEKVRNFRPMRSVTGRTLLSISRWVVRFLDGISVTGSTDLGLRSFERETLSHMAGLAFPRRNHLSTGVGDRGRGKG